MVVEEGIVLVKEAIVVAITITLMILISIPMDRTLKLTICKPIGDSHLMDEA